MAGPPGPVDAVLAFTAHHVVAAGVDPGLVAARLPAGDLSAPMGAPFLGWLGGRLVAAARHLTPPGEPLFAQVAPGNAASLRVVEAAGFRPIGAEVLFHRGRPGPG